MSKKQTKKKPAGKARKAPKTAARTAAAPTPTDRDPRLAAPLSRTYKGTEYRVTVLDAGFRFDGKDWRSLTAIARALTGLARRHAPAPSR